VRRLVAADRWGRLLWRVGEAWRVLRPRAIAQTHKRVDDLHGEVMHLEQQLQRMAAAMTELTNRGASMSAQQQQTLSSIQQLAGTVDRIESSVGRLDLRESQLRAITRR